MTIRRVTWADLERRADQLAHAVRATPRTGVYGIPRGGCVPAAMLAARLGLPLLEDPEPGALVVDDLVDSGVTAQRLNHPAFVAFFCKPWSPTSWRVLAEDVGDCWIVFPWEDAEVPALDAALRLLQAAGVVTTQPAAIEAAQALVTMVSKTAQAVGVVTQAP